MLILLVAVLGFESNRSNIRVIHNIVNDRSSSTLKQVISQLQSDAYSDTANLATIVKTICERYFVGTSVSCYYYEKDLWQ